MRRLCSGIILLATLALASCGSSSSPATVATATKIPGLATPTAITSTLPVTVTGADGQTTTVKDVSKIIPLNGDIAEIIWTLGLGKNIIATDISATYPGDLATLPKIGYQRQLAAEGIVALSPTLVIGTTDAGPATVLTQIRNAGIPVVILANPPTLDAATQKVRAVANALGISSVGEQYAGIVQAHIDAAKSLAQKAQAKPKVAFLYLRGATTQLIAGQQTAADAMITAAGGVNAAADLTAYQPITAEALVNAQPDIIVVLTAGLESVGGIDGLEAIPGIAQTPAGQQRAVLDYDDLYFLGMTPRAGEALMALVQGLHPDVKA